MKKFLSITLCLVLVLSMVFAMAGCAKEQDKELTTIRVIYHPTIGGSTAISTAVELGYFEEEGLDVRLQMFTSGPPEIAAMVAGQAEFGFIGSGAAWLAFSGQVNIIALDNLALTEEIIVRKDSGIKSIKDLKGKTIAVQEGAAGYTLLSVALQANGMSVNDVKIMNISNDNIPATFADTSIDCWAAWKPSSTSLKASLGDNALVIGTNSDYPAYAFPSTWVANKDYVKEHPDVTQKFVNALTKAQVWRAENPNEACAYASVKAGQATNDLTSQLPDLVMPTLEQYDNFYNTTAFEEMLTNLKAVQSAKVTGSYTIKDIYIDTFAKAAIESLKKAK